MKDPVDLDQLDNLDDDQLDFLEQILMRELQALGQAQERLRISLAAIKLQRQNNKKNKKK